MAQHDQNLEDAARNAISAIPQDPASASEPERQPPGAAGAITDELLACAAQDLPPQLLPANPNEQAVVRHLSFWKNGFKLGHESAVRRYDDPAQHRLLEEINAGLAPPSVFNVKPGELVEVRLFKNLDQDYVPPTKSEYVPPTKEQVPKEAADGPSQRQAGRQENPDVVEKLIGYFRNCF